MHPYRWSEGLGPRLEQATERMRQLRSAVMPPAAVQSLRHWFRIHHTYNSNAIEGNRLTLPETRAVLEDGITIAGKSLKDHFEAVNLAHALDFIESLARKDTVLGERDVREMHGIVLRGIEPEDAGVYRRINVRIGGTQHVPPEAFRVPEQMHTFGAWLAGEKSEHPVVVSAIAHTWFETIHPFVDGNGRTGRLLANLLLMREHYPAMVLLVEDRARYYAALDASHSGDLTAMVELTLDRVEQSFEEYERASREITEVQEPAIEYLASRLSTVQVPDPPELVQWWLGVEVLHGALVHIANSLNRRLESSQTRLTVSALPNLTRRDWATINRKRFPLFALQADVGRATTRLELQSEVHMGALPGWKVHPPVIHLQSPIAAAEPPRRFIEAVPTGHLFRVLRGTAATAEYIQQERRNGRALSDRPAPPDYDVDIGVSAQQIATEIWTYVVDHHLIPTSG
ncbi:Fic family protein [Corallococcus sp. BB11-1]|uniref:Fic family protein n=1 Tax=Corallococcus sp. BB11-1 TaxID=2996783 RepID=UPI002270EEAE|nr:Fic family protein [Corallococcus sp. BB11-1]MCY1036742.1 Fic family protein [Corallococcus sp. BB11-1]